MPPRREVAVGILLARTHAAFASRNVHLVGDDLRANLVMAMSTTARVLALRELVVVPLPAKDTIIARLLPAGEELFGNRIGEVESHEARVDRLDVFRLIPREVKVFESPVICPLC